MISKNEMKELLSAVTTIAIMAGTLRDRLMSNDFTREEAVKICEKVIVGLTTTKNQTSEESTDGPIV